MTLRLFKPSVVSKTGIRLAGAQGAPRVVELTANGLAACEPRIAAVHAVLGQNHEFAIAVCEDGESLV